MHRTRLMLLMVILSCFTRPSFACSCIGESKPCAAITASSVVFLGRIIETEPTTFPADQEGSYRFGYRMRIAVVENYHSADGTELIIQTGSGGGDCGTPLPPGEMFLLHAYRSEKSGELWTGLCSGNRRVTSLGHAELKVYRALASARTGSVSGLVTESKLNVLKDEDKDAKALASLVLRINGPTGILETHTDRNGKYLFPSLQPGDYAIDVVTPPKLEVKEEDNEERLRFTLVAGSCLERNFTLLPSGRISGRVLDATGMPVQAHVVLLPATATSPQRFDGVSDWTSEDGLFTFKGLSPGEYLIGVNVTESPSNKFPFAPTWYESAPQRDLANPVRIKNGEHVSGVDIHLAVAPKKRTIIVDLELPKGVDTPERAYANLEELGREGEIVGDGVTMAKGLRVELTGFAGRHYRIRATAVIRRELEFCAVPVNVPEGDGDTELRVPVTFKSDSCQIAEIEQKIK